MIQFTRCSLIFPIALLILLGSLCPTIETLPQRSNSEFINQRILRSQTKDSQKIKICGRGLMDMHQLVCSGAAPGKRSLNEETWLLQDLGPWQKDLLLDRSEQSDDNNFGSNDFLDSKTALALFGTSIVGGGDSQIFYRNLRGNSKLVEECCHNACTVDELKAYCTPHGR